ncbi:ribosome silencing factor [bacterium]|nr:ribosome silencing factor [bacterium]
MNALEIKDIVLDALDDLKAKEIVSLDVKGMSSVTDIMIVASGTSNRHVKSLADHVELSVKKLGLPAIGVEGQESAEWVLVDFGDVICHIMLPSVRAFYDLERLWSIKPSDEQSDF